MSDVSHIAFVMSGIPFVVLSTPLCGEHRSWRASTGQLNLVQRKGEDLGNNVGIMLRMCDPIFSSGIFVVVDSGFCVSKGIAALLYFGVYATALINKRKYWPNGVPGDAIDQYFADKDVTYVNMLEVII